MTSGTKIERRRAASIVVAATLVLAACAPAGGASPSPAATSGAGAGAAASPTAGEDEYTRGGGGATSAPAGGSAEASIKDFTFQPRSLSVAAGTTVTWTNEDGAAHTVSADDDAFDSDRLASGDTFSQTFATAGTYAYHCDIHPQMTGTIEVTP